jgi:hypothetical protein
MIQTNEVEYILKYNNKHSNRHSRSAQFILCRVLGFSVDNSRRMRDWSLSHVAQCHVATHYLGTTSISKG